MMCEEKCTFYDKFGPRDLIVDNVDHPRHYFMVKITQKKIVITVWQSAIGVFHYNFMQIYETITANNYCQQTYKMYSKSPQLEPGIGQQKRSNPSCCMTMSNNTFNKSRKKIYRVGKWKFASSAICSPDISPTYYHLFKHLDHFLIGKTLINQDQEKTAIDIIESRTPTF